VWIVIAAHMNCTRPTIRVVKYIWGQMLSLRGGSVVPRHKVLLVRYSLVNVVSENREEAMRLILIL
jgi:hypothetical protein